MAKKITLEQLESAVEGILQEYGDEVRENLQDITKSIAQKGAQAMKAESARLFKPSGKHKKPYSQTWTSTVESTRVSAQGIIYNTQAGLPHLLENGHVARNGKRVPGREHIARVNDEVQRLFEQEVERRL